MSGETRVGGYGRGGCTCSISSGNTCPMHGDDQHLSALGKREKAIRDHVTAWQDDKEEGGCPMCGAVVDSRFRKRHITWHSETRTWLLT